ncbi:methyltransferase domain-containing protein [Chitinophaga solisilvae]|uniref:methyltransferase domain-containing protein n=1 Tax=Chitinophaga solisilvae TaxID=1233460 RepID=UPI00136FF33A|nr:methyltransferase domain-containing protein [Chitinophaga solisilvae]
MIPDTTYRSSAPEIMDDFHMEGMQLANALDKIARINHMLGGNRITLKGVEALMKNIPAGQEVIMADIGCGNGDMLRTLAEYGRKKRWNLRLIGIDANSFTIRHATELSAAYPEIAYHCMDIMQPAFAELSYHIALCTLTLHHFTDREIVALMQRLRTNAVTGIVVNDLQRSRLAWSLFRLLCFALRVNPMTKADGLTSILRGFKKQELIRFAEKLQVTQYTLRWQWAFRYQWIISNV